MPHDDKPSTSMTTEELYDKMQGFFSRAESGHADRMERSEVNLDFKRGDQWDRGDLQTMDEEGRPALTINHILPIVKFLSGSQRQDRQIPQVRPEHDGFSSVASVLSHLAIHATERCDGSYELSECFEQGLSSVVSWMKTDIKYEDDINGEVCVRCYDGFDVVEDPASTAYDINEDAEFVIHSYWMSAREAKAKYPKKARELDESGGMDMFGNIDASSYATQIATFLSNGGTSMDDGEDTQLVYIDRYRVREFWWKEFETVHYLNDVRAGESLKIAKGKLGKARAAAKKWPDHLSVVTRAERVLNKTIIIGDVTVEHVRDPLNGFHWFPFDRYAPYYDGKRILGFIDNLLSPQREENKRRSAALEHLGRSANSGILVDAVDDEYKSYLEQQLSKGGTVVELSKTGGPFEQIQPVAISSGHLIVGDKAGNDMKEITGTSMMMGFDNQQKESGRALQLRQRQGATVAEGLFNNFDRTQMSVYRKVVELIRRGSRNGVPFYNRSEIERIVGEEDLIGKEYVERAAQAIPAPPPPDQPDIGMLERAAPEVQAAAIGEIQRRQAIHAQAMEEYTAAVQALAKEMFFEELRAMETGQYSVTVSQSPHSPTARAMASELLLSLAERFPNSVPPEAVIDSMDLPGKDKILARMEQLKQQALAATQAGAQ